MITVGSLFSGIGGIDLGLERAGMKVIWQSEIEPYACRVLAKHWPDVPNLGDIKQIDWSTVERPDLICGGFPCQPVSSAGRGRAQADERWLWPEVARCLRDLGPEWALLENVPGLLVHAMGDILGDLASLGYDAEWQGVPAAAVGAPHLRWRILILAHAECSRPRPEADHPRPRESHLAGSRRRSEPGGRGTTRTLADADGEPVRVRPGGLGPKAGAPQGREEEREWLRVDAVDGGPRTAPMADADGRRQQQRDPGQWVLPVLDPSHPIEPAGWWSSEPDVGRMVDGFPGRVDRLRCLGNAVVPQVAEVIGRRLAAHVEGSMRCNSFPPETESKVQQYDGFASREAGGLGSDLAGSGGGSGVQFPGPTDPPPSEQLGTHNDGCQTQENG